MSKAKKYSIFKLYKVKVTLINGKEKIIMISAENELNAMDQVIKQIGDKETVLDIKII